MLISFPTTLFGTAAVGIHRTAGRTVCSNSNFLAYTFNAVTNRVHNFRKKRYMSTNATWTLPTLRFGWFTASSTSSSSSYPTILLQESIQYGGTFYEGLYSGVNYKIVAGGDEVVTDAITTPSLSGEVEICTRIVLPLLFKTQTANFTVGEVVTGGTSGATGTIAAMTDAGTTGALTLISESGTWVNNEALTGSLGGAALVDLTTTQNLPASVGSQAIWLEGSLAGQNASVNWQTSNPVSVRMVAGAVTISAGSITAIAVATNGTGYGSASSVFAWEVGPDGVLYNKNIGNTNTAHTTITVTAGSPPSGLSAWVNPTIVITGGGDFGNTTAIIDCTLMEAIPSNSVTSLRLIGNSIARGYSSTDTTGDIYHNFGPYERAIANRFGVANMSISGTALGNQVQFTTTYVKEYALFDGKCTQTLIELGSNDAAAGTSKATMESNFASIAAHCRSFGEQVAGAVIIQRARPLPISSISKAANAVIYCDNSVAGVTTGDVLQIGSDRLGVAVLGMTEIRNLTATVVSATTTTITVDIDSTGFTFFVLSYVSRTGAFTVGQTITGATSGATAVISALSGTTTGTITVSSQTGGFLAGEIITDPITGSATMSTSGGVLPPPAKQQPETGFTAGGVVELYNVDMLDGTIVSDYTPINLRPLWQDVTSVRSWAVGATPLTFDEIHPSLYALALAQNDTTFKAQFNQLT